jgi:predicted enzyme related to lactoylglutathione lyase
MEMTSYTPGTPCWIDLGSPDPAASADFYSALLGWTVEDLGPEAGGYRMCRLRGKPVAGLGPQQQPGVPPYWTTYISVSDVENTTQAVRDAGGQVFVEPMEIMDAGRMAVFADSTGAPVSAWQPNQHIGSALVNETGTVCWNELNTRAPDKAKQFYADVFRWGAQDQQMDSMTYTEWKNGDRTVAGMMVMDERWPADVPSHWMTYFAVDDADASAAMVSDRGGSVLVPPTDIPPGRFSVVQDPHGASFGIIKPQEMPSS